MKLILTATLFLFLAGCWQPKQITAAEYSKIKEEADLRQKNTERYYANIRNDYVKAHPELPIRTQHAISIGLVIVGMTKEQVLVTRNGVECRDINTTVVGDTIMEQWAYPGYYIYFENGIVTGKQY
jgi:hypothetical protein